MAGKSKIDRVQSKLDSLAIALLDKAREEDVTTREKLQIFSKVATYYGIKGRLQQSDEGNVFDDYKASGREAARNSSGGSADPFGFNDPMFDFGDEDDANANASSGGGTDSICSDRTD
jgi:hypothetical protein